MRTLPLLVFAVLLPVGCWLERPREHDWFLALDPSQQALALARQPVEAQIDLYLAEMLYGHPPRLRLADALAENGPLLVDPVLARLRADDDELVDVHLIYALARAQELKRADVRSDSNNMRVIEEAVTSMVDPRWREIARRDVQRIRNAP